MNQGDLIEKVASAASITKAEAERAINAVKGLSPTVCARGIRLPWLGSERLRSLIEEPGEATIRTRPN